MANSSETKDKELLEKQLASERVFDGNLLQVYRDRIELPNGATATREYIKHLGASCVIPVTEDLEVIVERQFRYPFGRVMTEVPAGKLDSLEEDPLEAAKRELLEETGVTAEEWISLGNIYPTVAYSAETIAMFLAQKLHFGEQRLDEDEFLRLERIPLKRLLEQVMNGEIGDSKTQVCILKAARILGL